MNEKIKAALTHLHCAQHPLRSAILALPDVQHAAIATARTELAEAQAVLDSIEEDAA